MTASQINPPRRVDFSFLARREKKKRSFTSVLPSAPSRGQLFPCFPLSSLSPAPIQHSCRRVSFAREKASRVPQAENGEPPGWLCHLISSSVRRFLLVATRSWSTYDDAYRQTQPQLLEGKKKFNLGPPTRTSRSQCNRRFLLKPA